MFQFKSKEAKEVKHVSGHKIRVISILMTVILLLATLPGCIEEEERLKVAVLYYRSHRGLWLDIRSSLRSSKDG